MNHATRLLFIWFVSLQFKYVFIVNCMNDITQSYVNVIHLPFL